MQWGAETRVHRLSLWRRIDRANSETVRPSGNHADCHLRAARSTAPAMHARLRTQLLRTSRHASSLGVQFTQACEAKRRQLRRRLACGSVSAMALACAA